MTILQYNSAYEDITENAIDEYLALFAQKTMQFVRAPDENVYIAPFNLVEITLLALPFEWWLPKSRYEQLNDLVMGAVYAPVLFITALLETRTARKVRFNRTRGETDDDTVEEWEELGGEVDFEGEGWGKRVEGSTTDVVVDGTLRVVKELREEVRELKEMVKELKELKEGKS